MPNNTLKQMRIGSTYALVFNPNTKRIEKFSKDFSSIFGEKLYTSDALSLNIHKIAQNKGKMAVYIFKIGKWTDEVYINENITDFTNTIIAGYKPSEIINVTQELGDFLR